jgi:hypothetical protein
MMAVLVAWEQYLTGIDCQELFVSCKTTVDFTHQLNFL